MSGDEDGERDVYMSRSFERLKAIDAGHLDIKKHKIRFQSLDRFSGLIAIRRFADDTDILFRLEPYTYPLSSKRFIVRYQRTDSGNCVRRHGCAKCRQQ